jgi:hypothetical protein
MKRLAPLLALAALAAPFALNAATLQPVYLDAAGVGFNDATLGAARKATLSTALSIWGAQLRSSQIIKVAVTFDSLPCTSGAATLGAGEPTSYLQNFAGAPVPNRLYPAALAEALSRLDLNAGGNEIVMRLNANVDQGCAGSITGFDYNTNPSTATAPNKIRALPVMLHELSHGLGFFTPICIVNIPGGCSSTPGQWPYGGYPNNVLDRWSDFLRDGPGGNFWSALSSAQRITSARNGNLVWDGPRVTAALPALNLNAAATLGGRMKMHAPAVLAANASVNHFTTDATPDLLMEPDYAALSNIATLDLAPALLADLGWQLSTDPIATTTVITSDQPDPSLVNAAYTVNVTVSSLDGQPPGSVTIRDGIEPSAATCTANIQSLGQASCTLSSTIAGNRTLTATYAGSGVFQASSAVESHSVTSGNIAQVTALRPGNCTCSGKTLEVIWRRIVGASRYDIEQRPVLSQFNGLATASVTSNSMAPIFSGPIPPAPGAYNELMRVRACTSLTCGPWSLTFSVPVGVGECNWDGHEYCPYDPPF